jgi:outer membrane protein TolC
MMLALFFAALTMDEAVQRALRSNPEVSMARASLVVTRAETAKASVLPAPEFRFNTGNFDTDPDTFRERTTVALRYSPPRPREISLKQAIAQTRVDAARAAVKAAETRVSAAVRLAFRRAVMAQSRESLAIRAVALAKNKRRTLLRQVSAGLKESDEKDLADLDVVEAENALRRATSLAQSERAKLARLIEPGGAVLEELALEPELLAVPVLLLDQAELTERALSRRSELEVMAETCKEHQLERKLAGDQRLPWVSFVEVSRRVTYLPERGPWGWKFGVDLPFFRSAAAAEGKVAAARELRCRTQQSALAAAIRNEVAAAVANLESLRSELVDVDRLRSGPAERALQRTQLAFQAGRADQIDVYTAEHRLLTIQDRWLERRQQYAELEAQLEAALGAPIAASLTN